MQTGQPSNYTICDRVGAKAWLTEQFVSYLESRFGIFIESSMNSLEVPEISGVKMGFGYSLNDIKIENVTVQNYSLSLMPGVGLKMKIVGVGANISGDYRVKGEAWWNPLQTSGSVTASLVPSETSLEAHLEAFLDPVGAPVIKVKDFFADIEVSDLKVRGSILSAVIELLASIFNGILHPVLQNVLESKLHEMIEQKIDKALAGFEFLMPLPLPAPYDSLFISFQPCSLETTAEYFAIGLRGEVFNAKNASYRYPADPLPLPEKPPPHAGGTMLALAMTKWIVNSALWELEKDGMFKQTITSEMLPPNALFKLDTWSMSSLVPSWAFKFPPSPVTLEVEADGAPKVDLANGDISLAAPSRVTMNTVEHNTTKMAAKFEVPLSGDVRFGFAPYAADQQKAWMNIEHIGFTPVKEVASNVGWLTVSAMATVMQATLGTMVLPWINARLNAGFPLPEAHGIGLANTTVRITDIFTVSSDVTWNLTETINHFFGGAAGMLKAMKGSGLQVGQGLSPANI